MKFYLVMGSKIVPEMGPGFIKGKCKSFRRVLLERTMKSFHVLLLFVVLILSVYIAEIECKNLKKDKDTKVIKKVDKSLNSKSADPISPSKPKSKIAKAKSKKSKSNEVLLENVGFGAEKLISIHEREFVDFRNKIVKIFGETPVLDSVRFVKYPTGYRPLDEVLGIGYALISHGRFNGKLS